MPKCNAGSDEAPFVQDLRDAIRAYLSRRGMYQNAFCVETDLDESYFSQFMNRHLTGTAGYHQRLAEAIGMTITIRDPSAAHCASCDGHACDVP